MADWESNRGHQAGSGRTGWSSPSDCAFRIANPSNSKIRLPKDESMEQRPIVLILVGDESQHSHQATSRHVRYRGKGTVSVPNGVVCGNLPRKVHRLASECQPESLLASHGPQCQSASWDPTSLGQLLPTNPTGQAEQCQADQDRAVGFGDSRGGCGRSKSKTVQ